MLRPTPGLGPPCGYRHLDRATGITFQGVSWADVVRKLENYRRSNGMKVGDPLAEVVQRFCHDFPTHCSQSDAIFTVASSQGVVFGNAVTGWMAEVSSKGNTVRTVSEDVAEARARVCAACPRHRDWASACGCDLNKFDRLLKYLQRELKFHDTPLSGQLLGCEVLNEWCRIAVWLDRPPVNRGQPENCWRLR